MAINEIYIYGLGGRGVGVGTGVSGMERKAKKVCDKMAEDFYEMFNKILFHMWTILAGSSGRAI
jgi:hypothetical protein